MFDQLFTYPAAVARHRSGPLLEERLAFLAHLADQGYARNSLRMMAEGLLAIAQMRGLTSQPRKALTLNEVKRKTAKRRWLYRIAVRWLQFMGRLQQRPVPLAPWAKKIKAFAQYMEHEVELSPVTIYHRCRRVRDFFEQLHIQSGALHAITPHRIDTAFQKVLESGDYSRRTIQGCATDLRAFFRFAEARGWCRKGLAESIRAPRVFSQASLPLGPSWDDVRRLLATTEGDQPRNIRNRPILMLLAIYGLRRGEVSRLRLDDFDWEHEVFRVVSSKSGRVRTYPLTRSVGDAILRYLQEVRPQSSHRELFLSLRAPLRPLIATALGCGRRAVAIPARVASTLRPSYPASCLRHAIAGRRPVAEGDWRSIGAHGSQQHAGLCQGRSCRPP